MNISLSFSSSSESPTKLSAPLAKIQINSQEVVEVAAKRTLFGKEYQEGFLENSRNIGAVDFASLLSRSSSEEMANPPPLKRVSTTQIVASAMRSAGIPIPHRSGLSNSSQEEAVFQGPHISSPVKHGEIIIGFQLEKHSKLIEAVFKKYSALFEIKKPLPESDGILQYRDSKTNELLSIGITCTDLKTIIAWGLENVSVKQAKGHKFILSDKTWSCLFHRTKSKDIAIYLVGSRILKTHPVRRAWALHDGGQRVSLKTFSRDVSDDLHRQYLDSLYREHETLSLHPFTKKDTPLQKSIDFFSTDTDSVMIGKLYHGDLLEYLSQGPIPKEQWNHIAYQTIIGLELCHSYGLFYGDLKLENIFYEVINGQIHVYLADFAGSWQETEFRKQFKESSSPLDPNRFRTKDYCNMDDFNAWDRIYADRASNPNAVNTCWKLLQAQDVYALGLVLMYAALGAPPEDASNTYDELTACQIPEKQANLIQLMLSSDWEKRPTMSEIAKAWGVKPLKKKEACLLM